MKTSILGLFASTLAASAALAETKESSSFVTANAPTSPPKRRKPKVHTFAEMAYMTPEAIERRNWNDAVDKRKAERTRRRLAKSWS